MKNLIRSTTKVLLLVVGLAALASCNLPVRGAPSPTTDTRQLTATVAARRTQTAQALSQMLTQTAAAAVIPSDTVAPAPSDTPLPTLDLSMPTDTLTPTPSLTPTQGMAQPTQSGFKCGITFISPTSGSEIKKGSSFDFKVTFRNDGTATWKPAEVVYRYLSGPKYQKNGDVVKLSSNVDPGQTVTLTVDMSASSGSGQQNINWGLDHAGTIFCYAGVSIFVK